MKTTEIPQDQDPAFEGGKKLCYAVDAAGKFVTAQSSGWDVEATVKAVAWDVIHKDLARIQAQILAGAASPLEYHMKRRQMDVLLLAQNVGVSRWRVRWHLRPRVFARLSDRWLKRYAECLEIPVADLRGVGGEE